MIHHPFRDSVARTDPVHRHGLVWLRAKFRQRRLKNRLFCMLLPFPLRHITDSFPPDAVLLPIQSLSLP